MTIQERKLIFETHTALFKPSSTLPLPLHKLVNGFSDQWEKRGMATSGALKRTWSQIFYSMDEVIEMNKGNKVQSQTIVDASYTGLGKTQSMLYYLAHLPEGTKALVVTAQNKEADNLVTQLTALTYTGFAGVYNTAEPDSNVPRAQTLADIHDFQVLVISHNQYERSVKKQIKYYELTLNRQLICIDEELTMMTDTFISAKELSIAVEVVEHISPTADVLLPLKTLQTLMDKSQPIINEAGTNLTDADIFSIYDLSPASTNVEPIWTTIKRIRADVSNLSHLIALVNNADQSEAHKENVIKTINKVEQILTGFMYSIKSGASVSLVGGKLYIPRHNQIVFDATALTNELYSIHSNIMRVNDRVPGARNYDQVTLHYLNGLGVGQSSWVGSRDSLDKVDASVDIIINELNDHTTSDDDVLVIVHNKLEPALQSALSSLDRHTTVAVTHWGAFVGLNNWKDCNKVFIFGMNIKPVGYIENRVIGMKGSKGVPPFDETASKAEKELLDNLVVSELTAEVIQAINRIRCRIPTDSEGRCEKADVFLVLPKRSSWQYAIKKAISNQMPYLKTTDWEVSTANEKHNFAESPLLVNSIVASLNRFGLEKRDTLKTALIGKSLGYTTNDSLHHYNQVLKEPASIALLLDEGYQIQGTRYREFIRIK